MNVHKRIFQKTNIHELLASHSPFERETSSSALGIALERIHEVANANAPRLFFLFFATRRGGEQDHGVIWGRPR